MAYQTILVVDDEPQIVEIVQDYLKQAGYRVLTEEHGFHYHLGTEPAVVRILLPFDAIGYHYDAQARPVEMLRGSTLTVRLDRREIVLLSGMRRSGFQIE